jgi:hypothetical protein
MKLPAAAAVLAIAALATGCATPARPVADAAAPSPSAAAMDPATAIHIEVLERYLKSPAENSNLGGKVIYILDHTEAAAADPMAGPGPSSEPIPAAEQDAITGALANVAPVRFVATRADALTDRDGCAIVRDDGILMVLGPLKASGSAYQVPVHGFVACLGATWLTYVVERSGDGYQVTGTTGAMAVA